MTCPALAANLLALPMKNLAFPRCIVLRVALVMACVLAQTCLADATLDTNFNPQATGRVQSLALQGDGKILVGGDATSLHGQPGTCILRLNADGIWDESFTTGADSWVYSIAVQADGKIIAGGLFQMLGGQQHRFVGRVNGDGSLDESFNPNPNAYVYSIAIQKDERILIGGSFRDVSRKSQDRVSRLNLDGTPDEEFSLAWASGSASVSSVLVQENGRIFAGGKFTTLGNDSCTNFGCLDATGHLDPSFKAVVDGEVFCTAIQKDGKILIGGVFSTIGGQPHKRIGRLHPDGSVDTTFNAEADGAVRCLAIQTDGRVLVGGYFHTLGGHPRTSIGRLNADGALDMTFNPGADGTNPGVAALALQADGKIVVGGIFSTLAGRPCTNIGRLNNTEPATQHLSFNGSRITWLRGGTSPEVLFTTFEVSTNNGASWVGVGRGTRTVGGWELGGVNFPANSTVRARGHCPGASSGSSWICESFVGPLVFLSQPISRTNDAGTTVTFSVRASNNDGAENHYQWRKDGVNLVDGGNVSGVQENRLVLTNILGADRGRYSVIVSNSSNAITSSMAYLDVVDPVFVKLPTSLCRDAGESAVFVVAANGTPPLNYQWFKDGLPMTGRTSDSLSLTGLAAGDVGYYSVTVSNQWSCVSSPPVSLTVNYVATDTGFATSTSTWFHLMPQVDGKILSWGGYNEARQPNSRIVRWNADGSVDEGFCPRASGGSYGLPEVSSLALQEDGKILVGGDFTALCGQPRYNIGRLNPDGTLDVDFNPGSDNKVTSLMVQADGKIIVAGDFEFLGGRPRNYIGRLNSDGSLDMSFNPEVDDSARAVLVQADGKILVEGDFRNIGGKPCENFGRLNPDGSFDSTFTPAVTSFRCMAVQADGKILLGGELPADMIICRLNPDGSLDPGFVREEQWRVNSLAVQADGKIIIGGYFEMAGGQSRSNIARLHPDGKVDGTFNPGADYEVLSMALLADGKLIVGGRFNTLGGSPRRGIGLLSNTEPAQSNLGFNGSTITWMRGGSSPEFVCTSFEGSTNGGAQWIPLGFGTRIPGGWEIGGISLPGNSTVRARGSAVEMGKTYNGTSWFYESFRGPLAVLRQPSSRTNDVGTTASFTVQVSDPAGVTYQWCRNGTNLLDGNNLSGVRTSTLTLRDALKADEAQYYVIVSTPSQTVSSVPALLSVRDPVILTQPSGVVGNLGESVNLAVTAAGTQPFSYQWRKDGVVISGQTNNTLSLSNLKENNAGYYSVSVENLLGGVSSIPVPLTVNGTIPDSGLNLTANRAVYVLMVQRDGGILAAGDFVTIGGQSRNYIGRLEPSGSLDESLSSGANGRVLAMGLQADGSVVVGGEFTTLAGLQRNRIGRFKADGSLDMSFNPAANGRVRALAIQGDGKILVGGDFTTLGGQPRTNIGRLNPDGTIDLGFSPAVYSPFLSYIACLALQGDGKILIGGGFSRFNDQARTGLVRVGPDGSLDPSFNPGIDGAVGDLALQADGKLVVSGAFTTLGGTWCTNIGRLNFEGTADVAFNPRADFWVNCLALQPDGKILVGGDFSTLNGQPRDKIGRLNPDGSLDVRFNPGVTGTVYSLAVQQDGAILVGGEFTAVAGQSRTNIARLNSNGPMLPRIASVAPSLGLSDDGFRFNFTGVAGSFVVIEGSPDLENWSPIQTNFLNTSVSTFRDPAVTNTPTRYYRVKVQQP